MPDDRQVCQTVVVYAAPDRVFDALTRAGELREWCCDQAWTDPRPGGRYDLRWPSGYWTSGRFTAFEPPHRAAVTWHGLGELGQTAVEFTVEPVEGGARVTVVHTGFGDGPDWDRARAESEQGWTIGVENLKSSLETGIDLRLARRPFLGITLDVLTPERAAREGIATSHGIYVLGTVEGSGARAAGLQHGDVIVALDGTPVPGWQELGLALGQYQAGQVVAMELVRGQERRTVPVTLGKRPQDSVPATVAELAETLAARQQEINADLTAALEGLAEEEAGRRPAEGEWYVREVLAHLSLTERDQGPVMATLLTNGWFDAVWDNVPARNEAALAVAPTTQALLQRFLTDEAETLAFVRGLPPETAAHKARFHRLALSVGYLTAHAVEHIEQIKATIKAVRG